jgi:hypothetical protein
MHEFDGRYTDHFTGPSQREKWILIAAYEQHGHFDFFVDLAKFQDIPLVFTETRDMNSLAMRNAQGEGNTTR